MNIDWKPLPFFSKRWVKPTKIILHWSGGYTLESAFNTLKQRKLSYHYLVDGATIWQLVDDKTSVAYHAGDWLANVNSLGICHVGIYESPVKETTYATSGQLIAELCKRHNIEPVRENIRLHSEVKATACPGSLDVNRLMAEIRNFYYGVTPEVVPNIPPTPVDNPTPPPVTNTEVFPKVFKVVGVPAGSKLAVRREADVNAEKVGTKEPGEVFAVIGKTGGTTIQDNSTWLNTGYGYVHSLYTQEVT